MAIQTKGISTKICDNCGKSPALIVRPFILCFRWSEVLCTYAYKIKTEMKSKLWDWSFLCGFSRIVESHVLGRHSIDGGERGERVFISILSYFKSVYVPLSILQRLR